MPYSLLETGRPRFPEVEKQTMRQLVNRCQFLSLLALTLLPGCKSDGGVPQGDAALSKDRSVDVSVAPSQTRIFVTFSSHNDDSSTNADCAEFVSKLDQRYKANREAIVELANAVIARKAAYDFQSDIEYLELVESRDTADLKATTNGKNLIQYLAEVSPEHVSVDAHAHENFAHNYADVANKIEALGGGRNGLVGGFTIDTCGASTKAIDWPKFKSPLQPIAGGSAFVATALTLGASPGHKCDPEVSGIWHPLAIDNFYTDDPTSSLPYIGGGPKHLGLSDGVAAVKEMLALLRAGSLEQNRLYSVSLMAAQCNFDLASGDVTPSQIAAAIDSLAAEVTSGDLVWATYPQVLIRWKNEYGSQPSIWRR
jgi:hypothetical protein